MKKINIVLFLSLLLAGCSKPGFYDKVDLSFGLYNEARNYQISETRIVEENEYFKFNGRYYFDNNVCFTNFSSSGITLSFTGSNLEALIYSTHANDNKNRPYLAIKVDDQAVEEYKPIQLTNNTSSYQTHKEGNYYVHENVILAHNLEYKKHTISIYKRSECLNSKVGFKTFSCDGKFEKLTNSNKLKIEYYGDSVTCGYAVESNDYYENFSTRTENATKSFTFLTSNKLNAEASLISCGGYPMYKSEYSKNNNPSTIKEMISLASVDYYSINPPTWDNNKYIPDVVVIALGANDGSTLSKFEKGSNEYNNFIEQFKQAYIDFINTINNKYTNNPYIIISDEILPINEDLKLATNQVYEQLKSNKIIRATYDAFEKASDRTLPGEGHPNYEMHCLAANSLSDLIESLFK